MSKGRVYCCCAIPLVNVGIYITLVEQMVLGIIVGALSAGTPSIVGAATPSFASILLAIIAFVAAGVQVLGFIGVSKENIGTYRRYVKIHGVVTLVGFCVAATWIIWSAVGHDNAKRTCIANFFNSASDSDEGDTLCNIFSWVTVGVMGALWILFAVVQLYLFVVLYSYGKNQRRDHDQYDGLNDPLQPLKTENIPLKSDPWDSSDVQQHGYRHLRQESVSDIMNQPLQHPKDSMATANYGYSPYDREETQPSLPSQSRTRGAWGNNTSLKAPNNAS